jgi:acetylornithine deacetylase
MQFDLELYNTARNLLISLIEIPSLSRQEQATAEFLSDFFTSKQIAVEQIQNNIIVRSKYFSETKPTILLNSHHDTVKPIEGWNTNPHKAIIENGKIIGLGSNDAGAPLVSLIATFLHFYDKTDLPFNLILVASAEEEVSGINGIECVLPHLGKIDLGIVGEPTNMNLAIAQKGLVVIDCKALGTAGHAAHNTGENAIYKAMQDITWFQTFEFPKKTEFLGPVKMTVTVINAGTQHNVIPAECNFTVDVRTNECYTNKEVFEIVQASIQSEATARSFRLNSSAIAITHPIVQRGIALGLQTYGSPTLSDQAFMIGFPSVKIGPGDTHRSHTANEYILESEIQQGIEIYKQLLTNLNII